MMTWTEQDSLFFRVLCRFIEAQRQVQSTIHAAVQVWIRLSRGTYCGDSEDLPTFVPAGRFSDHV